MYESVDVKINPNARISSVRQNLANLDVEVNRLTDEITRLQDRLTLVLSPSPTAGHDGGTAGESRNNSELGTSIADVCYRLSNQIERLQHTIDSIDL